MPSWPWLVLLLLPHTVYCCYLLRLTLRCLMDRPPSVEPITDAPLRILVPMRNEADNIARCLDSLLAQPQLQTLDAQIIVIDDHSEDHSVQIVQAYCTKHPKKLQLLSANASMVGKKAALTHGIAHCPADSIIITTDADCLAGPNWLLSLRSAFHAQTQAVCGPVQFTGNSVFAQWQALELSGFMTLTEGHILLGAPTLANGANFAFRKAAYTAVDGYAAAQQVASGDDMLLLHKIAERFSGSAIRFAATRDAIVRTPAQTQPKAFWQQRLRWVSKASAYRSIATDFSQGLAYFANLFLLLLCAAAGLRLLPGLWPIFGIAYLLKLIGESAALGYGSAKYGRPQYLLWAPLLQPIQTLYTVALGPLAVLLRGYRWKGRKTR